MKVSPYGLKRPARERWTETFTSADGQLTFDIVLRKLSQAEAVFALDLANMMTEKYVTGYGLRGHKGYIAPQMLPPIDGQPVFVSQSTCQLAATIWRSQVAEDADRYSFEELLGFMVDDAILAQMMAAADKMGTPEVGETDPLASPESASSSTDSTKESGTTSA